MESTKAIFAERLKGMLEIRGISQVQFAKEMHTTPQAISSYVKGKTTPDYDMLFNIANRLQVSIDFLLGNAQTISDEEQQLLNSTNSKTGTDHFLHTFRRFAAVRDKMRILYGDNVTEITSNNSLVFQFYDELNSICNKYSAISDAFGDNNASRPELEGNFNAFDREFFEKLSVLMQDNSFHSSSTESSIISELIRMEQVLK